MSFVRVSTRVAACLLALSLWPAVSGADPVRYDGHKLIEVDVTSKAELEALESMHVDFWSHGIGLGTMEIRVSPEQLKEIDALGVPYHVLIADVQMLIDANSIGVRGATFFDDYHTYDEVNDFLDDPIGGTGLVQLYPGMVSVVDFGDSLEGRMMKGIKISGGGSGPKPEVLFNSGQHAREWITVPVINYVAQYLLSNYGVDPYVTELVDRCDWYLLPIMNPDGYVYTWTNERLWRKNRRDNGNGSFGVDLNRNWGYQWGGSGSSPFPNDETYRGPSPFSEPETQNMRDFFIAHPNIVAYDDYHCFGQKHLWPWGYTTAVTPDQATFNELGQSYVNIVASVHGTPYIAGPIASTLYVADGDSVDYAYGEHGILAFTTELRPPSGTSGGFVLPPDQIIPTCEEITPALLDYVDRASAPLRLTLLSGAASPTPPNTAATVQVLVEDNVQTVQAGSVTVHYREGSSGPYTDLVMSSLGSGEYEATLPGRDCGDPTEYYVSATGDGGGTATLPVDAPTETFSVLIAQENVLFADNFESAGGWTVGSPADDATTGVWTRVDPVGTAAQPEDDHTDAGTVCYVTGQGAVGGGLGDNDVDGGQTTLTSAQFDATADPNTIVSYWRWYSNNTGASPNADVFVIDISNDDGASWVNVETIGPVGVGTSGGWIYHEFRVADVMTPTSQMRMRFIASDEGSGSIVEAAIDDFKVNYLSCESVAAPCGDFDNDGDVDIPDFTVFTQCFGGSANPPSPSCPPGADADCDDDGDVDALDFVTFSQNFTGSL